MDNYKIRETITNKSVISGGVGVAVGLSLVGADLRTIMWAELGHFVGHLVVANNLI